MKPHMKRGLTNVALALMLAGYCAVPAAMAEDAAWVASGTTAEFEGTVPWLYREGGNATINSDDAGHIKVASDGKGTRPAGSETDKRLYSGDTITLGWDIGDNPRATVSSVTLTSTALDATTQAAKVKKGEAAPVVVTVKDSAGKPVPNVAFTLKRGDAVPRNSGATLYGDVAAMDDMTVQPASGTVVTLADSGNTVDGVTGADGTASFTVRQDNTPGYKTPLTVTLTNNAAITATLDTIFTVPTSPNVATAYFWGHMVDTATVSGKTLHRPLLKSELPSGATAAGTPTVNNETWALAHVIDANKWDIAQQCDSMNNAPTTAELQTLHSGFSSLGWPSSISFPYLSTDKAGSFYCGIEEGAGTLNCGIQPAKTSGFATCFR